MLQSFFDGKRVLVTGHTGFKGAWLATWLKQLGARVTGLALPPEPGQPNLFELAGVSNGMNSVFGDIRDRGLVKNVVRDVDPEIVLHLAAQPLVRRSYREPIETYETNVMGTANLLDALRGPGAVRSIVVITTDKCYENNEWEWGYRETDQLGGHDPYSSSKACAEILTAAYRRSFFSENLPPVGVATARAGNVVGGGDWSEDRIIPDIVRALQADVPVILRNPESYRPWQHVLEPLRGYLELAQRLWDEPDQYGSAWNFGPSDEGTTTVLALAERFVSRWGVGEIEIRRPENAVHEARALRLDIRKAVTRLNWRPLLSVDETLDWTIDWYRFVLKNPNGAAAYSADQIRQYSELAWPHDHAQPEVSHRKPVLAY